MVVPRLTRGVLIELISSGVELCERRGQRQVINIKRLQATAEFFKIICILVLNLKSSCKYVFMYSFSRGWLGPGFASTLSRVHKKITREDRIKQQICQPLIASPLALPGLPHSHTDVLCFHHDHCRLP